jgi:hypothetical protein
VAEQKTLNKLVENRSSQNDTTSFGQFLNLVLEKNEVTVADAHANLVIALEVRAAAEEQQTQANDLVDNVEMLQGVSTLLLALNAGGVAGVGIRFKVINALHDVRGVGKAVARPRPLRRLGTIAEITEFLKLFGSSKGLEALAEIGRADPGPVELGLMALAIQVANDVLGDLSGPLGKPILGELWHQGADVKPVWWGRFRSRLGVSRADIENGPKVGLKPAAVIVVGPRPEKHVVLRQRRHDGSGHV